MSVELMRKRLGAARASFIQPCLPSPATGPRPAPLGFTRSSTTASGSWPAGTRSASGSSPAGGHDWSGRYPLVVEAVNHLKVRSCLLDGEVVCCDERGLATFQLLRHRRNEPRAFLYAFDLLELNGTDLRRGPVGGG